MIKSRCNTLIAKLKNVSLGLGAATVIAALGGCQTADTSGTYIDDYQKLQPFTAAHILTGPDDAGQVQQSDGQRAKVQPAITDQES